MMSDVQIPDRAWQEAVKASRVHPADAVTVLGDAFEAAAPYIDRAARIDSIRGLIRGLVIREEAHKAEGNDGPRAGIRESITYLQDVLDEYETQYNA